MSEATIFVFVAILFFALIPFARKMLRLRIMLLRWLRWNWWANLLENHIDGFTLAFRIFLAVGGVVLLGLAWSYWPA